MIKAMKKGGKPEAKVVAYEKKSLPTGKEVKKITISKDDVKEKLGSIKEMAEKAEDVRIGEKDFGSSYRDLGLKAKKQIQFDNAGNASLRARYTNEEEDEEVSRIPNSDMLRVKKLGLAAQTDEPMFQESMKERVGRLDSEKKASLKRRGMELLRQVRLMDQMKKDYPSSFPKNK